MSDNNIPEKIKQDIKNIIKEIQNILVDNILKKQISEDTKKFQIKL